MGVHSLSDNTHFGGSNIKSFPSHAPVFNYHLSTLTIFLLLVLFLRGNWAKKNGSDLWPKIQFPFRWHILLFSLPLFFSYWLLPLNILLFLPFFISIHVIPFFIILFISLTNNFKPKSPRAFPTWGFS